MRTNTFRLLVLTQWATSPRVDEERSQLAGPPVLAPPVFRPSWKYNWKFSVLVKIFMPINKGVCFSIWIIISFKTENNYLNITKINRHRPGMKLFRWRWRDSWDVGASLRVQLHIFEAPDVVFFAHARCASCTPVSSCGTPHEVSTVWTLVATQDTTAFSPGPLCTDRIWPASLPIEVTRELST